MDDLFEKANGKKSKTVEAMIRKSTEGMEIKLKE
jgi:hypothetical protein